MKFEEGYRNGGSVKSSPGDIESSQSEVSGEEYEFPSPPGGDSPTSFLEEEDRSLLRQYDPDTAATIREGGLLRKMDPTTAATVPIERCVKTEDEPDSRSDYLSSIEPSHLKRKIGEKKMLPATYETEPTRVMVKEEGSVEGGEKKKASLGLGRLKKRDGRRRKIAGVA